MSEFIKFQEEEHMEQKYILHHHMSSFVIRLDSCDVKQHKKEIAIFRQKGKRKLFILSSSILRRCKCHVT